MHANENEFELKPKPPFNLEYTVRALQRRPSNLVDVFSEGRYYRAFSLREGYRLVVTEQNGSVDDPLLKTTILGGPASPLTAEEVGEEIKYILAKDANLEPFYKIAERNRRLRTVVQALRGLKPPRHPTIFEALVNAITFQQISLDAGIAILSRFIKRCGRELTWQDKTYYAFPEPEVVLQAEPMELRSLGFSTRKANDLIFYAQKVSDGEISFEKLRAMSTEEAIRFLSSQPGIGRWTAELVLLRGLGRLDIFPSYDTGARRGLTRLLELPELITPDEEKSILEPFGDQKGLLYFYSLGWRLLQMGVIS